MGFFHRPSKGIPDRWLLSAFRLPSLHASTGHPQWFFVCATAGRGRASAYRRRRPSRGSNTFHGTLIGPTARHYQQEESEKKNLIQRKASDRHHRPSRPITTQATEISGAENFSEKTIAFCIKYDENRNDVPRQ